MNSSGAQIQNLIKNADNQTFTESKKIFTNSVVTQQRLLKFNGFESEVLLPPINDPERFAGGKLGNYIFAGGRINDLKRQYFFLEAMRYTDKRVKLVIAGPPDSAADGEKLREIVVRLGLEDRVNLDLRMLPRSEYAEYLRNSLAVAYGPYDEDSLGYVTMEGASAGKALITLSDSGGITGIVKNGITGWISEPNHRAVAEVLNVAYDDLNTTERLGFEAREYWNSLSINWQSTVEKLTR
jgi:glycosyltransferase involved in cell wall biosynthesis